MLPPQELVDRLLDARVETPEGEALLRAYARSRPSGFMRRRLGQMVDAMVKRTEVMALVEDVSALNLSRVLEAEVD